LIHFYKRPNNAKVRRSDLSRLVYGLFDIKARDNVTFPGV